MVSKNDVKRLAAKVKTARVALMQACLDIGAVCEDEGSYILELEMALICLSEAFDRVRTAEGHVSNIETK